jgi:hypothetical protein
VRGLARTLNIEGIRIPSLPNGWKGDTVAQILANIAYIGKTYTQKLRNQQGELIDGNWPAIIDTDLWNAVQRQRRLRRTSTGPGRASNARSYIFQKLLRCSNCGLRMHAQTVRGRAYYRCDRTDRVTPCRALVLEDRLLPWAEALVERLAIYQPEEFGSTVDALVGGNTSPEALADIDAELERIGWRFDKGFMSERDYEAKWDHLHGRRRDVEEALTRRPALIYSMEFVKPGSLATTRHDVKSSWNCSRNST